VIHLSASDSFTIMALYKFTYLLTYLNVYEECYLLVRMSVQINLQYVLNMSAS